MEIALAPNGESSPCGANMSISDETIRRATEGDRACQQLIYEHLYPRVGSLVARIVGREVAEDVTQDVFIHVFGKLHTYQSASSFATWVYRVAVNDALQHLRRERRRKTVGLQEVADGHETVPDLDKRDIVEVALGRIDAELRVILQLKEVDSLAYEQIAEVLGIPTGTVGSRLNKARRELRDQLLRLGWEG